MLMVLLEGQLDASVVASLAMAEGQSLCQRLGKETERDMEIDRAEESRERDEEYKGSRSFTIFNEVGSVATN
ncbi:unnamed protein product [Ilex paraguariensis]|uniref:Uncharacterized protein n=1 Tax=Ilex paraguariensis TaxID=185542 RepID=A0ABC8V2R3_9AQUA